MRDLPIMFSRMCSKQPVSNSIPDLPQAASNHFREAFLVAYFVDERVGGEVEFVDATKIQLEYLTCERKSA